MGASLCCLAGRSWANARCKICSGGCLGSGSCAQAENLWNYRPLICISEPQHPRPDHRNASKTHCEHHKRRTNARQRRSLGPKLHQNYPPLTFSSSLPPHAQRLSRGAAWDASRSLRRGNQVLRNGRTSLPSVGLMRRRDPTWFGSKFLLLRGPILGQRAVQNMLWGLLGERVVRSSREPLEFSTPHMH